MSRQISCGLKIWTSWGRDLKKIKNKLLAAFFLNQSKISILLKRNPSKFYREFFCKFYRDFFYKIEGDFDLKGNPL